jgi:hypothetical protein
MVACGSMTRIAGQSDTPRRPNLYYFPRRQNDATASRNASEEISQQHTRVVAQKLHQLEHCYVSPVMLF